MMEENTGSALILMLFLVAAYFIPALLAYSRRHHNATAITMLNLLLGWTFLGWVIALIWALTSPREYYD